MKKQILIIIFTFLFFLTVSQSVMAADLTLTCNASSCTPGTNPTLFPSTEIWYPGKSLSKTVNLINISGDPITVNISNENTLTTGDLDTVINLTITRISTGINVFDNTINNFYGKTIGLPSLINGTNEDYAFTATMNSESGNEFQNKSTKFDLLFNFTVGSPPSNVSGGGGGDGTVSAPVCNDQKPGNAPILLSAVAGVNSVTLTWAKASDPVSYYLITFGTSPGSQTYGNPNVGNKDRTSYTVNSLSGGTTYYFKVRAGNGCMPGDFSNELPSTPTGGFIAGVPAGFLPGVLGEETKEASLKEEVINTGEIKGESTKTQCKNCNFLFSLIIEALLIIIYFCFFVSKFNNKKIYSSIIPIISYIIFYLQNKACISGIVLINSTNFFCKYSLLVIIGIYGLSVKIYNLKKKT